MTLRLRRPSRFDRHRSPQRACYYSDPRVEGCYHEMWGGRLKLRVTFRCHVCRKSLLRIPPKVDPLLSFAAPSLKRHTNPAWRLPFCREVCYPVSLYTGFVPACRSDLVPNSTNQTDLQMSFQFPMHPFVKHPRITQFSQSKRRTSAGSLCFLTLIMTPRGS